MLRDWIDKVRLFISSDPKRAKFLTFILLLLTIPLTVFAALTVQNILQLAGGGETVIIVDTNGNSISRTSDPNVFLRITLPSDWIAASESNKSYSFIEKIYAQSSCPTITCGTNSGAGGTCTYGDPIEGRNSNVSGCTATCPNGKKVPGFSVSVCQTNNCYYNDCTCYPNPGACDSQTQTTPTTTSPLSPSGNTGSCPQITAGGNPGAGGNCSPGDPNVNIGSCTSFKCISRPQGIPGHTISVCAFNSTANRYCYDNNPNECWPNDPCPLGVGGQPVVSPTPSPFISFPSLTPSATPIPQRVLKNLYIANNDSDGSAGGSESLNITSGFDAYLNKPIPWKLNPLLEGQNEASRVVQVTLFDGSTFVPYIATINLVRPTQQTGTISSVAVSFECNLMQIFQDSVCHGSALAYDSAGFPIFDDVTYEWGISSVGSIGSLEKIQGNITGFVAKNVGTGSIWVIARRGDQQERKGIEVTVVSSGKISAPSLPGTSTRGNINDVINQYGKRGSNLSGDVNRDGVVDGIDYNILLRNEPVIAP